LFHFAIKNIAGNGHKFDGGRGDAFRGGKKGTGKIEETKCGKSDNR